MSNPYPTQGRCRRFDQLPSLFARGYNLFQASQILKLSPVTIVNFLNSPEGREIREQISRLNSIKMELLYSDVVKGLSECISSENENIKISAIQTWLKFNSKLIPQAPSAEDVVIQILNQNQTINEQK